ncbi:MAG TPA: NAD(P)H-hydrate dehydratase [Puia sp.]|nr:NAD(P)H-hydrate dehydratase [Puia sp.]
MQILSAEQIRKWDEYTILNEPIQSIDLMEMAATKCVEWLRDREYFKRSIVIFCGKGNNGGDGLAIARLLSNEGCQVTVAILEHGHRGTEDFQINLARLHETSVALKFIQSAEHFNVVGPDSVLIDALLGSGLNRPLDGLTARLVDFMNKAGNEILAIDIPSGLFADSNSQGNIIIRAKHTLSFQCYKLSFLLAQNQHFIGDVQILDIGLNPTYLTNVSAKYELVDNRLAQLLFKPRSNFSHKGTYGHAVIIAGSFGKMGAAVLAAKACLKAGAGLLTVHIPGCGYTIMQTFLPEAMVQCDTNDKIITGVKDLPPKCNALGVGPGIGTSSETFAMIKALLGEFQKPIVIDADGLNILASNPELLSKVPPYSILTPHPKEFERLFGKSTNEFEQLDLAIHKADKLKCIVILKGHRTFIATPEGKGYFNSTGNAGMAKGGSGDILTGMLTSLLAQNYEPWQAAVLGVFLHGLAGDFASAAESQQSVLASDIINHFGDAFLFIQRKSL